MLRDIQIGPKALSHGKDEARDCTGEAQPAEAANTMQGCALEGVLSELLHWAPWKPLLNRKATQPCMSDLSPSWPLPSHPPSLQCPIIPTLYRIPCRGPLPFNSRQTLLSLLLLSFPIPSVLFYRLLQVPSDSY